MLMIRDLEEGGKASVPITVRLHFRVMECPMDASRRRDDDDPTLQYLRKIPTFEGMDLQDIQQIFGICRLQQYTAEKTLYRCGDPSEDMLILLEGTLSIRTSDGLELSQVSPVGLVGEMGVLTGDPRSADVVSLDNVMGLLIDGEDLLGLWARNASICRKMLLNVVRTLSRKLHEANRQMEHLRRNVPEVSKELDEIMAGNVFLY